MEKPTDGQLLVRMSHALGRIGEALMTNDEHTLKEIARIYDSCMKDINGKWDA